MTPLGQQQPGRDADLREGPEKAAPKRRCVLDGHQCRAASLRAVGDALDDADEYQQCGRPDADGGVSGQHADQGGGRTYHHQRPDQNAFAPEPISEVAGQVTADGTEQEADGQFGEGGQGADQGIPFREERGAEVGRGRGAVDKKS